MWFAPEVAFFLSPISQMSKTRENIIFESVYGNVGSWTTYSHEAPDFVCKVGDKTILGVEITEYFNSETDARLKAIPGYGLELLQARAYRHKVDRLRLRLEKVTYLPGGDEAKGVKVDAIIQECPTVNDRLERLSHMLFRKTAKSTAYLRNAPIVDLIISDSVHAFAFETFTDFYSSYSNSQVHDQVIKSPFREIFLITNGPDSKRVCVPLKANAFAEEAKKCEKLFLSYRKDRNEKADFPSFICVLADVLSRCGSAESRLKAESGRVSLRFASIEFAYSKDGIKVSDHTYLLDGKDWGSEIGDVAQDIDDGERSEADLILKTRQEYFSCVPLFFPSRENLVLQV